MAETVLARLLARNNWANDRRIGACAALDDAQPDAAPSLPAYGAIRQTLAHLAATQQGYLRLPAPPPDDRRDPVAARRSGAGRKCERRGPARFGAG